MAQILLAADTLTVSMRGAEKIEALHGNVTVPRASVTRVRVAPDGMAELHGIRAPGRGRTDLIGTPFTFPLPRVLDDVGVVDDLTVRVEDEGRPPKHEQNIVPGSPTTAVRPQIAATLVVLGAVALVALLWAIDWGHGLAGFDRPVYTWFVEHRTAGLTPVMKAISTVSSETVLPFIVLVVAAIMLWRTRHLYRVVLLGAAMFLTVVIAEIFKLGLDRHRPPVATMVGAIETNGSFPSFHTLGATTFALLLGYLWWKAGSSAVRLATWLVASLIVFGLVASSRLYLGYHWASDVLASAAIAVIIMGAVIGADRVLGPRWAPQSQRGKQGSSQHANTHGNT
ncbi:MAG: phosphatase PAP2 family protein [Candidatus Nanopelagicales bacterium]